MRPEITYELRISFPQQSPEAAATKEQVADWLRDHGVDSFVEGVVEEGPDGTWPDDGSINFDLDTAMQKAGISVFKYDAEELNSLKSGIEQKFAGVVNCSIDAMETAKWLDGWKDSFKPIITRRFFVHPPWDKESCPKGLIKIEIEPGVAFGTGQHATTQLCLRALESLPAEVAKDRWLDVGTGTGILAIAARKLGVRYLVATDIDTDSVMAASRNAELNDARFVVKQDSVPRNETASFDAVIANILTPVLRQLMPEFRRALKPSGWLLLSGLLTDDVKEIVSCAERVGLKLVHADDHEGWACLVLQVAA